MVRATRGVVEGVWYFEIRVVKLGESGHTHLGKMTDRNPYLEGMNICLAKCERGKTKSTKLFRVNKEF
ncbi:hypothetical protein JHK85_003764 [Glycine max]|nr:hypothetical protein JHK85_003764 [Glycine max]